MENDDWRKLLKDNKNFDQKVPYDLNEIVRKMTIATKDLEHLNPYYLLSPVYDFTKFFSKISSALSMGFSDITEKVEIMRQFYLNDYSEMNSIQELVEFEMSMDIEKLNGENNADLGHAKGDYKKYISGSRTFLRLLWFMEFLICVFKKMLTEAELPVKEILKNAYEEVLAPRHPWVVKKAVAVALTFAGVPRNEALLIIFNEKEETPEARKKIEDLTSQLEVLWKAGRDWYEKKKLLSLE